LYIRLKPKITFVIKPSDYYP